jgi:hypothetical protein
MKTKEQGKRCAILCTLFEHLHETYGFDLSREIFADGRLSLHQLDALLAFKSDARVEELRCALERLDQGVYGVCIRCHQTISDALLNEDPARRVCTECEEEFSHSVLHESETDMQL